MDGVNRLDVVDNISLSVRTLRRDVDPLNMPLSACLDVPPSIASIASLMLSDADTRLPELRVEDICDVLPQCDHTEA